MELGYIIAFSAVAIAALVLRPYVFDLYHFVAMRQKLRGTIDKETLKALGIDDD